MFGKIYRHWSSWDESWVPVTLEEGLRELADCKYTQERLYRGDNGPLISTNEWSMISVGVQANRKERAVIRGFCKRRGWTEDRFGQYDSPKRRLAA
jgi:hypothetical protein